MPNLSLHRPLIALSVAAVAAACAAAPAAATTVTFGPDAAGTKTLRIADGAEATDAVEVLVDQGGTFTVRDTRDVQRERTITAGTGCTTVDAATIRCGPVSESEQGSVAIQAFLGGGDDLIRIDRGPVENGFGATDISNRITVDGGAGDDLIRQTVGHGVLSGGDGNDVIGRPVDGGVVLPIGAFTINGNAGNDMLELTEFGARNTVSGGPGFDRASYFGRTSGVTVNQAVPGGDGSAGEDDTVQADVEHLRGTEFDDVLVGGPANNELVGDLGIDVLRGGDGFDKLIAAGDGVPDQVVDCGPQPETFVRQLHDRAVVELADAAPVNCEVVESAPKDDHPTVQVLTVGTARLTGRVLRVRLRCPRRAPATCRGRLALVHGDRDVARRTHRLPRGKRRSFALRVPRAFAARARRRALDVTIQAREKAADGRPKVTSSRIRLRG